MAGPQFFHLQTYSRKPNKTGQSVEQVLAEARRDPMFSTHVSEPRPFRVIAGVSPHEVQRLHDEMVAAGSVAVTLKDGRVARRSIRTDRHTLLTAVASHPHLTAQIMERPEARRDYDAWVERNLTFLRGLFGERLVSVIEHVDEEHPHLHAYVLPLDDPACSARDLNPCWLAKSEAEAGARAEGHDDKTAVKHGNHAYRERARALQDQYHREVGLPSGLTRTGPKRERLSRQQWRARKDEASRNARTLRQMEEMVSDLADQEDELSASAERMARDLEARLHQAEVLHAEAEAERHAAAQDRAAAAAGRKEVAALRLAAEEEVRKIRSAAEQKATDLISAAEEIRAAAGREAEAGARKIQDDRRAFEAEKAMIARRVAQEAAAVAVLVLVGVLTGKVGRPAQGSGWEIRDRALRERVEALQIGSSLREAVTVVTSLWDRLKARLSAPELAREQENAAERVREHDLPAPAFRNREIGR
ncbi:hypothetical protein EOW65_07865 [Sinirhodobacter ferrireducens]|uniref:Mob protein n=1 Tax=Paenirhodobacter ferrireducens TaxID=1215032 RepID=A0A443LL17_9RHOB|nr:hypothetical protein [Sinirhodobacter ferrireducens]RWR49862.1 hypothetical protein EOW65_07865 [Sinirhodobacter ferrireducens]